MLAYGRNQKLVRRRIDRPILNITKGLRRANARQFMSTIRIVPYPDGLTGCLLVNSRVKFNRPRSIYIIIAMLTILNRCKNGTTQLK
jgi:hypothetical protein